MTRTMANLYCSFVKGFTVGMQVPSSRPKGGLLNSVMLSIVGNTEEDITLSIQSARTSQQIVQYHAELTYIFNELRDDVLKKKTKNTTVCTVDINFHLHRFSVRFLRI